MHKAVCSAAVNQAFQPMSTAPSNKLKQPRCIFIINVCYSSFTRIFENIGDSLARAPWTQVMAWLARKMARVTTSTRLQFGHSTVDRHFRNTHSARRNQRYICIKQSILINMLIPMFTSKLPSSQFSDRVLGRGSGCAATKAYKPPRCGQSDARWSE